MRCIFCGENKDLIARDETFNGDIIYECEACDRLFTAKEVYKNEL